MRRRRRRVEGMRRECCLIDRPEARQLTDQDGHAASDFVRVIEKEWEQLQPKSD